MLEKCSGLNDPQREQLINVVIDFMKIVKKTDLNPLQLISIKMLRFWWKIYPDRKTMERTEVALAGRNSSSSQSKWLSCIAAFFTGIFVKSNKNCKSKSKKMAEIYEEQTVFETAFEADRLSAAFSGEGSHAGLAGVCRNSLVLLIRVCFEKN